MNPPPTRSVTARHAVIVGILSGTGAALFWAVGFVAARHGIAIGFSPADIAVHRFVWAGIAFLAFAPRLIGRDLHDIFKSVVLTFTGGPTIALLTYAGFLFVPLAHGGVIQPSCAAIGGLALAGFVLREKLTAQCIAGVAVIVAGLAVIGSEALAGMGMQGVVGDLCFVAAGLLFAVFATLLRLWRIAPLRAVAVTSVVSLAALPVHWLAFGFERMIALGLWENLLQALVQGVFAGAGATYFFTRSVVLLGASRAAVFPSLVPGFTLLIGFLALGEQPTLAQVIGFVIVLIGFQLTQR